MPAAECFLCFSFWTLKQNKVRVSFVYIGNMCIQTHADGPRHALNFCYELACNGVPYELHTFEEGPHSGALYDGKHEDSLFFHIQPVGLPWLWNGWRIKDSESRKIRKQLLY